MANAPPTLPKEIAKDGAKWLLLPSKVILDSLSNWPERQNSTTLVLNVLCVASFSLIIIGQVTYIMDRSIDLQSTTFVISLLMLSVATTVRRLLMQHFKTDLVSVLNKVYFEFWPSNAAGNALDERLNRESWYLFGYWATYMVLAFLSVIQYVLVPYFQGELPHRTNYPFLDWRRSPCYELLYVWESFLCLEMAFNVCGLDLFFISLLLNCGAQFKLLGAFLKSNFIPTEGEGCNANLKGMTRREILVLCIRRHAELIRTCKEIEGVFTFFILIQYMASIATVCLSSFVATAFPGETVTALMYLMGHLSEIFIYCYMGENLIIESTELSRIFFECGWHLDASDMDLQKSIILVMIRSQKPVLISAGGFGYLSLSSFMKLIQFSFSVYTLLNKLMDKGNFMRSFNDAT